MYPTAYLLFVELNTNCNSTPSNVNPEFGANEPGCGCTFSYNGGAGAGTAAPCCDGTGKPYEDGFSDKKRDPACCCEASRCYERPLVNKKPVDSCSADFKYVPEFNYPPPPCPPADHTKPNASCCQQPAPPACGCDTYQGGLINKKPECSADFKYIVPSADPKPPCTKDDKSCCGAPTCCEPDTYESIKNTDAQRYKGKGPDRKNFYADDSCGCQCFNNANGSNVADDDLDWAEIRKLSYELVNSPKLTRRLPSFYCESEHYAQDGAIRPARK